MDFNNKSNMQFMSLINNMNLDNGTGSNIMNNFMNDFFSSFNPNGN